MAFKEMLLTGAMAAGGVYAAEAVYDATPAQAGAAVCTYETTPDGPWGFTEAKGIKFQKVIDYHKSIGDKNDTAQELFALPAFDYLCVEGTSAPSTPPEAPTTTAAPAAANTDPSCTTYTVAPGKSANQITAETGHSLAELNQIAGKKKDSTYATMAGATFKLCGDTAPTMQPATPNVATTPNTTLAPQYTVSALQAKTNELLVGYGMPQISTDGNFGPETQRAVCTAEWLLGLTPSRAVIKANSDTARSIMAASGVLVPPKARGKTGKWADANKTCQSVVFGTGNAINMIYKTSSGDIAQGMDTPVGNNFNIQAYDPAPLTEAELENGTKRRAGWHDSSTAPSPSGLGNMYKPVYFNGGIAFHGADQVPTVPKSHKCLRLTPSNMDTLILWLGLGNRVSYTNQNLAKMAVIVEGAYNPAQ